jgi:hypothetical protein
MNSRAAGLVWIGHVKPLHDAHGLARCRTARHAKG